MTSLRGLARHLYFWVVLAILAGGTLGYVNPSAAVKLKPLGDGFIALVKMLIGPVIFCTVVLGISGRRRHEEGRPRRRQGADLFRSAVDRCAGDRAGHRERDQARRRLQHRSAHARRESRGCVREGCRESDVDRLPAAHHSQDVHRRLHQLRRPAAGPARGRAVRLRDDASRRGRPVGAHVHRGMLADLLRDDERHHETRAARRRRRDGVHDRQLRDRCAQAAGHADGQLLPDLPAVHPRRARRGRRVLRIQHRPVHRLHSRRTADRARHVVIRIGARAADAASWSGWAVRSRSSVSWCRPATRSISTGRTSI